MADYENQFDTYDTNGYDIYDDWGGGSWALWAYADGVAEEHFLDTKNVTEDEWGNGMYCVYTNIFSGSSTHYDEKEDTRSRGFSGYGSSVCVILTKYTYSLDVNDADIAYVPNGRDRGWDSNWGWVGQENVNTDTIQTPGCGGGVNYVEIVGSNNYPYTNGPATADFFQTQLSSQSPTHETFVLANGSSTETGTKTIDLDTEYTDGELYGNILSLMPPYPSGWYVPNGGVDLSSVAYSAIDAAHVGGWPWTDSSNAELQKMKYQFGVPDSQWGVEYKITWDVITYDLSTGSSSKSSLSTTVQGTGDPSNPALSDEQEALPPDWDQSDIGGYVFTWVDNVHASIVSKSKGTPPGTGPFWNSASGGGSGCSTCSGGGPAAGSGINSGGMSAKFSMGRASADYSAGDLQIGSALPTPALATPAGLVYDTNRPNVVAVKVSDQIRQVKAPEALADIVVDDAFSYEIKYYLPSQVGSQVDGVYQVSGAPFVTWKIQNPDASTDTYNRLRLTETRGTDVKVYDCSYTASTGSWKFDYPGGVREDEVVTTSTANPSGLTVVVTSTTRVPGGPDQFKVRRVYQATFPNGNHRPPGGLALVEETLDPDTNPKTTAYTYDNSNVANGLFHPLKMVVHPDGSWQYYIYNYYEWGFDHPGQISAAYSSFGDQPAPLPGQWPDSSQCRRIVYYYDPVSADDDGTLSPNSPRTTIEYVKDEPVSTSYLVVLPGERREIRCQEPYADPDDPDNLVTITKYYTDGPNTNRVKSIENPDGTMAIYEYAQATDGSQTNTVWSGQPNVGKTAIVDGVKTVTIIGPVAQMISRTQIDIASGVTLSREIYGNYDEFNRPQQVTHLDGTSDQTQYACCGVDLTIDRDGAVTQYWYDGMKRQVANTRLNITTSYVLDSVGNVLKTIRIGSDNSQITLNRAGYDLAGRLVAETNALGGGTAYVETQNSLGALVRTTTNPGGGTRVEEYYLDGSLKQVTGTAVHPVRYVNDIEWTWPSPDYSQPFSEEIKLNTDGTDSSEWTKTYTDALGRTYKTLYPDSTPDDLSDNPYSQSFYNNQGQLWKQVDPDGVTTFYTYTAKGEQEYTIVALNNNTRQISDYQSLLNQLDSVKSGNDRITWTQRSVVPAAGGKPDVIRSDAYVWQDGQSTGTLLSRSEGSTDGLNTWQTVYRDASTPVVSHSQTLPGTSRVVTTTAPDNSYTISTYSYGRLISVTRSDALNHQLSALNYSYDPHGRQRTVTDARNGATTYSYNNADQVNSVTTPAPGNGQSAEVTTTLYDSMIRPYSVINPDSTTVNIVYLLTGELGLQYGSRTYPVAYSYDYAGRMQTMTNWSNFSTSAGARVTTWNYDVYRGWLTNKAYADGNGPVYTCTSAGRLSSRTWARTVGGQPLDTTYTYDNAGSLTNVVYSDSTPSVTNNYDRLGRLTQIGGPSSTESLTYNLANEPLGESFSGGPLDGLSVTNGYDAYLRRTAVALSTQPSTLSQFGYDAASRLSSVTNGQSTATYTYLANSPLISQITFKSNTVTRMTTSKQYDYLNRLTGISSSGSAGVPPAISFAYQYNPANQRTKDTLVDNSYWVYNYDSLGQVTSGHKYFYDQTPVPGQQFDYSFDDIGNRKQTLAGGDQAGGNQRQAAYMANNLNQVISRDYPGTNDVIGVAFATNSVTVNGQTAWRKGEYFWALVKTNNSAAAIYEPVTIASGGTNINGNLLLPKTPQTFVYDADGNLVSDGLWTNTWNAENRLIEVESQTSVPSAVRMKEEWSYLPDGRWNQRIVSSWNGSVYVPQYTNHFEWDGKVLLAILDQTNGLVMSFMRGLDLGGSMQGAGGVGGLLAVSFKTNGTHFGAFDGNGNVAALISAADGTCSANYEYDPFGQAIRITGSVGKLNPIRFSTQFANDVTGDLKYFYRIYGPGTGNWKSRDPKEEKGGYNLYGFVRNIPITHVDRFGLSVNDPPNLNLNTCCCDSKTRIEGLKILTQRWRDAAQFLDGNGVGLDPDGVTGVSCIDSANRILSFMSPTPRCWICYIERRGTWGAPFGGGDENYVRCDDVTQAGGNDFSFAFDWWYEKDAGYKTYSPIPMWRYAIIFPYGPWDQPGAWWTKNNPAPYDDCINKSGWKNGPENYAMFLQPLVDQYGHKSN